MLTAVCRQWRLQEHFCGHPPRSTGGGGNQLALELLECWHPAVWVSISSRPTLICGSGSCVVSGTLHATQQLGLYTSLISISTKNACHQPSVASYATEARRDLVCQQAELKFWLKQVLRCSTLCGLQALGAPPNDHRLLPHGQFCSSPNASLHTPDHE